MGWGTLSGQGTGGSCLVWWALLRNGGGGGSTHVAPPQVAGILAVPYPPPADLGGHFGQGQEEIVEERSHGLVEAAF